VFAAPGRPALLTLTIIQPQNRISTFDSSYSRYCSLTTAPLAPEDQTRHFERTVATPVRPDRPQSTGHSQRRTPILTGEAPPGNRHPAPGRHWVSIRRVDISPCNGIAARCALGSGPDQVSPGSGEPTAAQASRPQPKREDRPMPTDTTTSTTATQSGISPHSARVPWRARSVVRDQVADRIAEDAPAPA
jgi:hypothetical protein